MKEENTARRRLTNVLVLLVSIALLATDQITKYFVLLFLLPVDSVTLISGLLEFSYIENTGAAFGLFKDHMWVIYTISVFAFIGIGIFLFRYEKHTFFSYSATALILAGGVGNLIDRFLYGYVVDFIHVMFFGYVFNFADCCITVGAVLVIIHVLLLAYREKNAQDAAERTGEETE